MTRTPILLSLAAAAALAGCNNDTIVGGPGSDENAAANANLPLPPSISATKAYRCGDNTIVQVDWLSDNKSANLRAEQGGAVTQLTAPEPGQPMVAAGGYELTGSAGEASIKLTLPGGKPQTCRT